MNKVDRAYEITKEAEEAGMKFDRMTYNTLIAFFSKIGEFVVARRVMKKMIKEPSS
ncbi:hypothetical protein COLO4_32763 [Corchorus olitorius]|uniref:Pentatricopeptide repeat-containing protein n=1 Tax=Corchorus olitorius TaxID=93759 RepID=A0A1R3GY21_9ROSI|nr:hypothetical protein COLO4_32763 [Corchorus olitorius]